MCRVWEWTSPSVTALVPHTGSAPPGRVAPPPGRRVAFRRRLPPRSALRGAIRAVQEHDAFFKVIEGFDAVIVRCNPGQRLGPRWVRRKTVATDLKVFGSAAGGWGGGGGVRCSHSRSYCRSGLQSVLQVFISNHHPNFEE